ncbi:reverse transcriptase, partial [Phytophthora palmivora]
MDHIPSLPRSHKGTTELLIWIDLFTGYVIAKASASRTAQNVAENYEECVFRRFGASEAIRHDREPGFMISISEIETTMQNALPSHLTLPKIASEEKPRFICYTAGTLDL